jgi:hypothetical protein
MQVLNAFVAYAPRRAASTLVSMLVPGVMKILGSIETSLDAARTSAYATGIRRF